MKAQAISELAVRLNADVVFRGDEVALLERWYVDDVKTLRHQPDPHCFRSVEYWLSLELDTAIELVC